MTLSQRKLYVRVFVASLVTAALPPFLFGQQSSTSGNSGSATMRWWNPEWFMDYYVKQLTRQYNLTPDQEEFTRKLLTKRVKEFLQVHESELRTLTWEMMQAQSKRQLPSADTVQQWSKIGRPIFEEARKAILDGNKEWREVLDDKQKQIHDRDLKLLDRQFGEMKEKLDRWSKGDVQQTDFERPSRHRDDRRSSVTWELAKPEDMWESQLNLFVLRYNLDPTQRETARSILAECKKRAAAHREKNKSEFEAIEARMNELKATVSKGNRDEREKVNAAMKELGQLREKRQELEKPIASSIGNEFRTRLEQIPTKEQREAYERKQEERTAAMRKRAEDKQASVITTQPTSAPATASGEKKS